MRSMTLPGETYGQASIRRANEKIARDAEKARMSKLTNELKVTFADMDANLLAMTLEWAAKRRDALKAWKESDDAKKLQAIPYKDGGQRAYYDAAYAIAGGATWFQLFSYYNEEQQIERITKDCKRTAEARNFKIAKKLAAKDITTVGENILSKTAKGYFGTYTIATDKGNRLVKIECISAGGYNIQCWHYRVLCNVK